MAVLIPVVIVVILLSGGSRNRQMRLERIRAAPVAVAVEVSPTQTPRMAAHRVFEALKTGDFEKMSPVVPTVADMEFILAAVRRSAPEKAEQLAAFLGGPEGLEGAVTRMRARSEKRFRQLRDETAADMDWAGAAFGGLDEAGGRTWQEDGCELKDVAFTVRCGEREETFLLPRCTRTPRGWVTGGRIRRVLAEAGGVDPMDEARARAQMASLAAAVRMYTVVHGKLPASLGALAAPDPETGEPYIDAVPVDPWGNAYLLRPQEGTRFQIVSPGPDGRADTADDVVWR